MGNCNLKAEDESSSMSCKYIKINFSKCQFLMFKIKMVIFMFYLIFLIYFIIELNKSLFEYKYAIGRGGFGKVWKVSSSRLKNETIT